MGAQEALLQAPLQEDRRASSGAGACCQRKAAGLFSYSNERDSVPAEELRLRPLLPHGRLEDGLKLSKIVELNLAGVQR